MFGLIKHFISLEGFSIAKSHNDTLICEPEIIGHHDHEWQWLWGRTMFFLNKVVVEIKSRDHNIHLHYTLEFSYLLLIFFVLPLAYGYFKTGSIDGEMICIIYLVMSVYFVMIPIVWLMNFKRKMNKRILEKISKI